MKKIAIILTVALCLACAQLRASDPYTEYIETYSGMAVEQQQAYGIPASITLAQGLLESAAGRSTLATRGNNHFGIKCHSDWTGDTLLRSDDAPDECFRAYRDASESYHDHSRFLLRKRYAPLFELDPADYRGWASTLRKCGYATDPNYASRLITIIERYALYLFDSDAGRLAEENTDYIRERLFSAHPVRKTRGLHYVISAPGDTYASISKEFNVDKKKLLEYNDRRRDGRIKDWEEVYLEPKLDAAPENVRNATIGEGESMHSVSQRYGMKLSVIKSLNPGAKDRPGTTLRLR